MYILMFGIVLAIFAIIITWTWQKYFDSDVIAAGVGFFVIGLFLGVITYDFACNISLEQAEVVSCEELIELVPVSDTAGEYIRIVGADELKYLYSYETEDGIQKATISIDDATIQYGDRARLVRIEYSFANKFRDWLFPIYPNCDYTFYIPTGAIVN